MFDRRQLIAGLAASALPLPYRSARAQITDNAYTIFQITYRGETEVELGFSDYFVQRGIPVNIIHRSANLDPANVPEILEEVRRVNPDLVYTWGTPVTIATYGTYDGVDPDKNITDIPGVFTMVSTPVRANVVPTEDSSERNITGTSHVVPLEPQLRAMQAYREFDTLGVLYTPTEPNSQAIVARLRDLATTQGFRLVERTFPVSAAGQPSVATAPELVLEIEEEGAQWLYYLPDTFLSQNIDVVATAATLVGLPGFSAVQFNQDKALLSLVSRYYSLGQLTAYKAEQILVGGIEPDDIPVERLERFALVINMPLAKELGLFPPLGMLSYANVLTE